MIPVDPTEARREIAGLTPDAAAAVLIERWQLDGPPDIYRDPAWLGVLPRFPSRIQIRVEYDSALAAE